MSEKTEALRLADALRDGVPYDEAEIENELRRLHAEVERLSLDSTHSCHAECQRPLCKLTRERDALLKALLRHMGMDEDEWNKPTFDHARAAIAKAEGEGA